MFSICYSCKHYIKSVVSKFLNNLTDHYYINLVQEMFNNYKNTFTKFI